MGPAGPEVIINFMIALTDYTDENGATRVIPGSNRWADYEDRGQPEDTVPAVMDAGDVFFFSGKTAHGGGANVTKDQYRRGVAFAFQPGYLVPEEAYPFLIDMELAKIVVPPRSGAPRLPFAVPQGQPRGLAGRLLRARGLPQPLTNRAEVFPRPPCQTATSIPRKASYVDVE